MAVQAPATILFSLFYMVFCTGEMKCGKKLKMMKFQVFYVNFENFAEQVLAQKHFYLLETGLEVKKSGGSDFFA